MAELGPAMASETLGKILLVGLCGLTHYKRLELLATFAVTTVIVDFLIFMRYKSLFGYNGNFIKPLFFQFLPSWSVSSDRADVHQGWAAAVGCQADHQVAAH